MSDNKGNENIQLKSQVKSGSSTDNKEISENETFLDKIIEILTGLKSEDRIKKRKLKDINKELMQSKKKYYVYKTNTILPAFAQTLYEIYRDSQILVKYFDVKNHNKSIKDFLFESSVSKKLQEVRVALTEESIKTTILSSQDPSQSIQKVKDQLKIFVQTFDNDTVNRINMTYNQIINLSYLISFDWFFILHKFDSNISETNFSYTPVFENLEGKYISDDIISINDYLTSIDLNQDYGNVFTYLNQISQDTSLTEVLKKLIHKLKDLKRGDSLIKIIKLIIQDPFFKAKNFSSKERIVQDYVSGIQLEVRNAVEDSIKEINKNKVNKVLQEIFNTTTILRMKNYSNKLNEFLLSKGVGGGLKYVDPLNYIKAFILDICKGEIKTRIDFLIIKGTWESNTLAGKYTGLLEKINKFSARVIEFDEKCAEDGYFGKELRKFSTVLKHDKNAQSTLKRSMANVDSEAMQIIIDCIDLLIEIGKEMKSLVEDFNQKNPKQIINFHKLKWDFNNDFNTDMANIYKKLSSMVSLLKKYVVEKPKDTSAQ